jgi:hypothetical protein
MEEWAAFSSYSAIALSHPKRDRTLPKHLKKRSLPTKTSQKAIAPHYSRHQKGDAAGATASLRIWEKRSAIGFALSL